MRDQDSTRTSRSKGKKRGAAPRRKQKPDKGGASELRHRAEKRLAERRARKPPAAGADPRHLLHELEVHQMELTMQNDELRVARREIEAGLQRYTEIFHFAPIGYFVMASDGTIREANLAAARLLRTEPRRLVGRPFSQFVADRHQSVWNEHLRHVLTTTAENHSSEAWDLALAGRRGSAVLEVHITGAALAGPAPTALVSVEDVTGRKHHEAEVRDESRHKDEFMAMLSHELRNPLAPIRNSLFVLGRAEPGGEQASKARAIIDRQVTHLTRIVDDLLDFTRIARGKVRLQREPVELGDLVRRTLDDHREEFEGSGIHLEARLGSERFGIDADATRIVQVLGNLLGNAVKFTARGGRVEVILRREGQSVALIVRDTGVGIAPGMRARLFEPFSQAPQTLDRTRGGLGLGLAMVKGLVELHGGTVDIASEGIGHGSEFTVRLPLLAGAAAATKPGDPAQSPRRRVLVIEDNRDAADSLAEVLEIEGHTVAVAYDGPAGLALARDSRPEIIICDIGLPRMDGYGVARALRAEADLRDSFLIALTGNALAEDLQRAADAGFDRHIAKPPSFEKLAQLLTEAPMLATQTVRTSR